MGTVTVTTAPDTTFGRMVVTIAFSNTAVTACKVERSSAASGWVVLRSASAFVLESGAGVFYDSEVPFDTPVSYRVTQVTPAGTDQGLSAATVMPSLGVTWLRDPAYPSYNMPLREVTSLTTLTYPARAGVFSIIDRARPLVVAAKRMDWTGELAFTTATMTERSMVLDLIARGQILLLSTPGTPDVPYGNGQSWGLGNLYVHVGEVTESRVGVVSDPTRAWTMALTRVDRPADIATMTTGLKWNDVKYKYATWGDLIDTGMTWNELQEKTPETLP